MSREIKFRAWDGNEIIDNFVVHSDGKFQYTRPRGYGVKFEGEDTRLIDPIVMQYTGLLDKNGTEIYEGDIAVIPDQYIWFDGSEPNYRGVVEWIFSQWQVVAHCVHPEKRGISNGMNEGLNDEGFSEGSNSDWLVLGNIYENPCLLECNS